MDKYDLYDAIIDAGIATEEEVKLATCINGYLGELTIPQ